MGRKFRNGRLTNRRTRKLKRRKLKKSTEVFLTRRTVLLCLVLKNLRKKIPVFTEASRRWRVWGLNTTTDCREKRGRGQPCRKSRKSEKSKKKKKKKKKS